MREFDQGTIIYGLRSDKYPTQKCYGILITASCDVAQKKVSKYYFLIAISVKEWICSKDIFTLIYSNKINTTRKTFDEAARKNNLDPDLLENFNRDDVETVINQEIDNQKKRTELLNAYEKFMEFKLAPCDISKIKSIIKSDSNVTTNPTLRFVKDIESGKYNHYYFLPQQAYVADGEKSDGLIIDFQEIVFLSSEDVHNIINPGIDHIILDDYSPEKTELYKKLFWLEEDNDFVKDEGQIKSPWREHLMQRFSYCFIRIGLDNPTDEDYGKLLQDI